MGHLNYSLIRGLSIWYQSLQMLWHLPNEGPLYPGWENCVQQWPWDWSLLSAAVRTHNCGLHDTVNYNLTAKRLPSISWIDCRKKPFVYFFPTNYEKMPIDNYCFQGFAHRYGTMPKLLLVWRVVTWNDRHWDFSCLWENAHILTATCSTQLCS